MCSCTDRCPPCVQVFALGVCSVFEQVLESLPAEERTAIFNAYIQSLGEEPETYRRDAAALEAAAGALTSANTPLVPDASGLDVQKTLARVAEKVQAGKLAYSKFFAIGLFRWGLVRSRGEEGEAPVMSFLDHDDCP